MALRDNISGREYQKFVDTADGAAVRTALVSNTANQVSASSSRTTVTTAETILIQKQTLNGKKGSWFVYNSGNVAIDVSMYSAYISGAANFATATGSTEWDKVGSTQNIAAGNTKHIPFNNVYRYVALAASTSAGTATGTTAELFAL
jgi:hypothetical protein